MKSTAEMWWGLITVITSKQISADLLSSVVIGIGKYEIDYLNNFFKYKEIKRKN